MAGRTRPLPMVQHRNRSGPSTHVVRQRMCPRISTQPHLAFRAISRQASSKVLLRTTRMCRRTTRLRSQPSHRARRARVRSGLPPPLEPRPERARRVGSALSRASSRDHHGASKGTCGAATRPQGTVVSTEPELVAGSPGAAGSSAAAGSPAAAGSSALIAVSSRNRESRHSGSRNGA